jgi:hypothetical protein
MRFLLLLIFFTGLLNVSCEKKRVSPYCGDFAFTNVVTWTNYTNQTSGGDTLTFNGTVSSLGKAQLKVNCWEGAIQSVDGCHDKPVYSGGAFSPVIDPETGVLDFTDYMCTYSMVMSGEFQGHDVIEFTYSLEGPGTDSTFFIHGIKRR